MPTNREIVEAWNQIEDMEPEISTEQLFSRVCDYFNHEIDEGDVAAAIAEEEA